MPLLSRPKRKSVKKPAVQTFFDDLVSLDTEGTGLYPRHGDKPFMAQSCDPMGDLSIWEWPVDSLTRRPSIPPQEKHQLANHLEGKVIVFHNAKFDIRSLCEVGFEWNFADDGWFVPAARHYRGTPIRIEAKSYHDTQCMAHACASGDDFQRLKELASRYLKFGDEDEKALGNAVNVAARFCRSHGLEVSLGKSKAFDKDKDDYIRETKADYWLPKFVYDYIQKTEGEVPEELEYLKDVARIYGGKDAERTILLALMYFDVMKELNVAEAYEGERQLIPTVYKMEDGGITYIEKVARIKLKTLKGEYDSYAGKAHKFMQSKLGNDCKLGSYPNLMELLYDKLKLPVQKKKKKDKKTKEIVESITVDAKAIEKLMEATTREKSPNYNPKASEFLKNLVISRKYKKGVEALESYGHFALHRESIPGYCWLYPSFNQTGTATTRFSSNNPNGQNISKVALIEFRLGLEEFELPGPRLRDIFAPPPGKIWYATDYNQLELRIFAFVSQEQKLIEALNAGYDFHGYTATQIFDKPIDEITKAERRIAKNTNFSIIFGASPWKVNLTAGISDAYERFAKLFPNVTDYMNEMNKRVRKDGCVRTVDGYRLDVPTNTPYMGVSYQVQGTAGRIIKNAMKKIDQEKLVDWEHSRIAACIHDELITEIEVDHKSHKPSFVHGIMEAMRISGEEMGVVTPASCEMIRTDWGHGQEMIVTKSSIKPKPKKKTA